MPGATLFAPRSLQVRQLITRKGDEREGRAGVGTGRSIAAQQRDHAEEDNAPVHVHHLEVPPLTLIVLPNATPRRHQQAMGREEKR